MCGKKKKNVNFNEVSGSEKIHWKTNKGKKISLAAFLQVNYDLIHIPTAKIVVQKDMPHPHKKLKIATNCC